MAETPSRKTEHGGTNKGTAVVKAPWALPTETVSDPASSLPPNATASVQAELLESKEAQSDPYASKGSVGASTVLKPPWPLQLAEAEEERPPSKTRLGPFRNCIVTLVPPTALRGPLLLRLVVLLLVVALARGAAFIVRLPYWLLGGVVWRTAVLKSFWTSPGSVRETVHLVRAVAAVLLPFGVVLSPKGARRPGPLEASKTEPVRP